MITFLTTYSETKSYEIETNTNKIIDKSNNVLDKIKQAETNGKNNKWGIYKNIDLSNLYLYWTDQ